jgi:hypothetical protein
VESAERILDRIRDRSAAGISLSQPNLPDEAALMLRRVYLSLALFGLVSERTAAEPTPSNKRSAAMLSLVVVHDQAGVDDSRNPAGQR